MKIVALGDSITEGFPYSPRESWVNYAVRELNLEILNQGICGDLTLNMRERFRQDVLAFAPTHGIILGGTNDAALGYPVTEVSPNFKTMVDMSREHGIIPILALPIPSLVTEEENLLMEYRNWLKDYAIKKNLKLIDFYSPFHTAIETGQGALFFADEVHPTLEGYKLMGQIAIQSLREICVCC